jgi:hypothetical protein
VTFELRTYTATPGRLEDVVTRFRDHTVGLLARHGMESVGYWTPTDPADTLIYIVRHTGDPETSWREFRHDSDWIKARDQSLANGEIVEHIDSVFMTPTDFSAIS